MIWAKILLLFKENWQIHQKTNTTCFHSCRQPFFHISFFVILFFRTLWQIYKFNPRFDQTLPRAPFLEYIPLNKFYRFSADFCTLPAVNGLRSQKPRKTKFRVSISDQIRSGNLCRTVLEVEKLLYFLSNRQKNSFKISRTLPLSKGRNVWVWAKILHRLPNGHKKLNPPSKICSP